MSDFFVSYTKPDEAWAEWISWVLEEAHFSVIMQAWDFGAGGNFVLEMQRAGRSNAHLGCIVAGLSHFTICGPGMGGGLC
jgi:TIR domain